MNGAPNKNPGMETESFTTPTKNVFIFTSETKLTITFFANNTFDFTSLHWLYNGVAFKRTPKCFRYKYNDLLFMLFSYFSLSQNTIKLNCK